MKKIFFIRAVISSLFIFSGCQKFNDIIHNDHPDKDKKAVANVALDWNRLQLRFLLEKNSSLKVDWGYLGIGLYESVR